jgi:NADPH:quinone reductase-like Zn-dependent oxidoreductase
MKASVYTRYGPPDVVLHLVEVAKPVPKDDEVLIRLRATTVNRTDTAFLRARPFINRFFTGLFRPRATILGSELAGEVEAVGDLVRSFKPGDQVFGLAVFGLTKLHLGAHAEYVCLPEAAPIAQKPSTSDFEQAAAVPDGAMQAMGFIRKAGLRAGQRVLVYGASGSIGTAAVQLAKHYGAEVTAVCDTRNLELVRSLGADAVIDYTTEDFTRQGPTYDAVFDVVGKSSFGRCRTVLKQGGVFLSSDFGFLWQNTLLALWPRAIGGVRVKFPTPNASKKDVILLKELVEAGEYRAVIDRRYPLDEIVAAYRYVETGQKTGNVVITI